MRSISDKPVNPSHCGNILIVDDNVRLCRSLELILTKKGHSITVAHNGAEALEKVNSADFDMAILDLKLPDMEGIELLNLIAGSHPDIAIIIATGHATVESAVKALTNRAVAYVTKPLDMDEFLQTVSVNIEKQRLLFAKSQAERNLMESEVKYRILAEESPQGIAILADEGIIYANKAIAEIFGIDLWRILSMKSEDIWECIHPSDVENLFQQYQEFHSRIPDNPRAEFRVIRPDGKIRYLEVFVTTVEAQFNTAIQIIVIDRTSVRKAEQTKELHQKEIEIYNSLLRHDLGNDLQVVLGELEFLKSCTSDLTEDAQQSLESAMAGAERMYNLITALKGPVDDIENRIMYLIKQIVHQYENTHTDLSISITPIGDVDNLTIRGSRLLPMVFVNLFSNSLKHARKGVTIDLSITREANQVIIEISDDGPGVPSEIQDTLFQRGVSTTGGGLGLYLSKRIIEAIEGTIEYIPRLANGAQFKITLPLDFQERS